MKVAYLTAVALMLLSTSALAQTPFAGQKSAQAGPLEPNTWMGGAQIGLFNVENVDDLIFGYGVTGDYALTSNVLVGGSLNYWDKNSAAVSTQRVGVSDFSLGAHTKVLFTNLDTPLRPYAIAGLGIHRITSKVATATPGEEPLLQKYRNVNTGVAGRVSIDLGAGVMYQVQKALDVTGQVEYRKLTGIELAMDQLAFQGGVAYSL